MKVFNSVVQAYPHYIKTGETCVAIYPYDKKALYLSTTKRSHAAVLYKDGKDHRFFIDRVGA